MLTPHSGGASVRILYKFMRRPNRNVHSHWRIIAASHYVEVLLMDCVIARRPTADFNYLFVVVSCCRSAFLCLFFSDYLYSHVLMQEATTGLSFKFPIYVPQHMIDQLTILEKPTTRADSLSTPQEIEHRKLNPQDLLGKD